jgi:DMSO/TMAO reductase YedYZ molybdopterin-dependent catalytic subunit
VTSAPPRGQRYRADFPRFGLPQFASRFPAAPGARTLFVGGDAVDETFETPWAHLPRVTLSADFHCVTTWSYPAVQWSGVRFAAFYETVVAPRVRPQRPVTTVLLRGQDGYRTTLPLAALLDESVLLADTLEGQPLPVAHGAPLRLVTPAHYGYKAVKHLTRVEFWASTPRVRPNAFAFMDHPTARVAEEERGQWLPGWLLRRLYRPLIGWGVARFASALAAHEAGSGRPRDARTDRG